MSEPMETERIEQEIAAAQGLVTDLRKSAAPALRIEGYIQESYIAESAASAIESLLSLLSAKDELLRSAIAQHEAMGETMDEMRREYEARIAAKDEEIAAKRAYFEGAEFQEIDSLMARDANHMRVTGAMVASITKGMRDEITSLRAELDDYRELADARRHEVLGLIAEVETLKRERDAAIAANLDIIGVHAEGQRLLSAQLAEARSLSISDEGVVLYATTFVLQRDGFGDDMHEVRRWVVMDSKGNVWSKGEEAFIYEPLPSDRDEDFMADTRFATRDEAFAIANAIKSERGKGK